MATAIIDALSHNIGHATIVIPGSNITKETNTTFPHGILSTGRITFPDNRRSRARFIRVVPEASIVHVNSLLNHWCDGPPSLVMSITGGAKAFTMSSRLSRAFQRGLLKVARTTGAWIITGGMNKGIMEAVGQLVQKNPDPANPIHLIGIATWGCVSGHEQLQNPDSQMQYFQPDDESKGQAPLEPNHTEFIFVDDGTEGKYGGEIEFRARLEEAISGGFFGSKSMVDLSGRSISFSGSEISKHDQPDPVPVVLIVVEGGPNTLRTVHNAVIENDIPAVFLDGTGRCCNLFAKAYRVYNEYREKLELTKESVSTLDSKTLAERYDKLKNYVFVEVEDDLKALDGEKSSATTAQNQGQTKVTAEQKASFDLIYECIHTRYNFLNIITLDPRNPVEPDIDLAILRALLNALSGKDSGKTVIQKKREQLRLALEWDRLDIAEQHIMKNERNWEKIISNELFALALSRNQTTFVQLFLDHRFSLLNFCRDNDPKVKEIIDKLDKEAHENAKRLKSFDDVSKTFYVEKIHPLIRNFFQVNATLSFLPKSFLIGIHSEKDQDMSIASASHNKIRVDFEQKLFLWALVTGRRELTMLFWSRGRNKICAALIATLIFKKLADLDNDNSYYQSASEFESLAVTSLHKLHQNNKDICPDAIVREIHAYGDITWLELAVAAEAKEFVAHQAVQEVLNNIWFGHIDQNVTHFKIVFSTIMLWHSGFLSYNDDLVKSYKHRDTMIDAFQLDNSVPQRNSDKRTVSVGENDPAAQELIESEEKGESHRNRESTHQNCCQRICHGIFRYFNNVGKFICSPYVKFLYHLYFHVIFLLLFSYVILCDFFPLYDFPTNTCSPTAESSESQRSSHDDGKKESPDETLISLTNVTNITIIPFALRKHNRPSVFEFIILIWILSLILEEIRQLITMEAQSIKHALVTYFQVFWNKLDILAIILFFVGFSLRFINNSECYCIARIVLSVDLGIWFMRSLDIFAAVKRLGPKLVMIGEMFQDLNAFMIMLAVFILAFGVSSYSLIYGVQQFSWHLPRRIINLAYWPMFGELKLMETFENHYGALGYTAFILLVAYMVIVSILLVNLLIAMFSNIFDRLQTDTDRIWKFQRYSLVYEYLSRPAVPAPFILFAHLWRLSFFLASRCCKSKWIETKYNNYTMQRKYRKIVDKELVRYIQNCEDASADEVYYNYLKAGKTPAVEVEIEDKRTQSPQENTLEKIRNLETSIQMMNRQHTSILENLTSIINKLETKLDSSIRTTEQYNGHRNSSTDETSRMITDLPNRVLRLASVADGVPIRNVPTTLGNVEMQPEEINFYQIGQNVDRNDGSAV